MHLLPGLAEAGCIFTLNRNLRISLSPTLPVPLSHSTLMHLLPGLAVFAHRYHTPLELRGWRGLVRCASDLGSCFKVASSATAPAVARPQPLWVWLVVAPLAFYLAWQLLYFLVVQVRGAFWWFW